MTYGGDKRRLSATPCDRPRLRLRLRLRLPARRRACALSRNERHVTDKPRRRLARGRRRTPAEGARCLSVCLSVEWTFDLGEDHTTANYGRYCRQMKGICVNFLDPDLFFSDFLRDIAMATDFGQNLRNDLYLTRWHFATDSNIAISQLRLQTLKAILFATFFAILVKIGQLTPEIMQGVYVPFGTRRQKSTSYQISQQVLDRTLLTFQYWFFTLCSGISK